MSMETWREELEIIREVREMWREFGLERADMLSQTTLEKAQKGSTQSSGCAEGWGLLSLFFKSEDSLASLPLAWMVQALALEADDDGFGQSFAEWLGPPQNMHKLLLKWCCLSCGVNFPSLPSLSVIDAEFLGSDTGAGQTMVLWSQVSQVQVQFQKSRPEATP